ncbi:HU family DNA-binding protein [Actinomadura sp. GC306]|uniref:HU family DNA-binding protein n=1 Tax=Actinomadura sp. GC306 TaxID=2530367 RepID=UPI0014042C82|nr:HU family DNA-binding protein [Actinomadura sp. GC306]
MNRSELVRAVAERAGSDEAAGRRHVDAVFEVVMERVSAGERVTVTGFGTFDRLSRPARSARNPRTGAPIEVAAAEVPRFRSGRTFRTRVAGGVAVEEQVPEAADGVVAESPASSANLEMPESPEAPEPKAAKKAKKGANAKKALKKAKAVKVAAPSKNGKGAKNGKKKQAKGKGRVKAGK